MLHIKAFSVARKGVCIRFALISDVHSNLPAFETVLESIEAEAVDSIIHAGDVVGYNPFPNEVIRLLRQRAIRSIRGNHDRAALTGDTRWFNAYAARAVEWTRGQLTKPSMEYLGKLGQSLEVEEEGLTLKVFHGSPRDEDEYIYPDEATPTLLQLAGCDILVMGHTHVPFVSRTPTGLILNPGSVGQPRDGDPRAAWILLDSKQRKEEVVRVTYDIGSVYEAILEGGLPQFLAERLLIGR